MSSTKQIFESFNKKLKEKLIPGNNEPVYSAFSIDCKDAIFSKSFNEIIKSQNQKIMK